MRIIGGKDYYDNALSLGHDETVVFVRQTGRVVTDDVVACAIPNIQLQFTNVRHYVPVARDYQTFTDKNRTFMFGALTVIFCGRLYRGVVVSVNPLGGTTETVYLWQTDKFIDWLTSVGLTLETKRKRQWHGTGRVDDLFADEPVSATLLEWQITNQVVVAIRFPQQRFGEPTWEINSDRLHDIQFFRVINPFQAFQEIEMWIGGVLPGQSNLMIEVDDQTRISKHGFDKQSFRRAKQP